MPRDRHDPPPADTRGGNRDNDNDHRGRRERHRDRWYSRLTRSLSRAPTDREREHSASRHGGRRHQSLERGGRRQPLHSDVGDGRGDRQTTTGGDAARKGARQPTQGDAADAGTGARLHLVIHPADALRRARGQSRERATRRRPHRRACSEPRNTTSRSKSPLPRLRCKSPDFNGGNGSNHHPSPSPPKVPPTDDRDVVTQQRARLAADRRFRMGQVYARRPGPLRTPRAHTKQARNAQVVRFRPGAVYSRRRVRGLSSNSPSRTHMANELQQLRPEQNANAEEGISQSLPPPILQVQPRQHSTPNRRKKPLLSTRRSVRIAAMNWQRGDTQARARLVLMKRLGILDRGGPSHDDALLCYFDLYKGPPNDDAVKAMTALCGLDADDALPHA
ncbi:unnamed protein product [Miscanthus lutarioriparius]|uniref:Uncharacterized protein n=1 Tax=Miscanthus lutarioriparius TaxID=422564 RepID=A0A811RK47_9POAL|nr:unnamed protein product [Miscanthus lutarioriparius]